MSPMKTNDICQPQWPAIQTVTNDTMTPMLVPELKMPVAKARSFCGNHMATALMEAGKLAASANPSTKRTMTNPSTVATRPCAAAAIDQMISAQAKAFFTPTLSMMMPMTDGNIAYANVKAVVMVP